MRHDDSEPVSPYYPPRSTFFRRLGNAVRATSRRLRVVQEFLPANLTLRQLLLGMAVPGYSYRLDRLYLPAYLVLAGWVLGLLVFLLLQVAPPRQSLGFQMDPAYLALGLAISLHATGANYLVARAWHLAELRPRILTAILVTAILIFGVYFPLWGWVQHHWFMPVDIRGVRLVVNPSTSAGSVRRGQTVLYRITGSYAGGVLVQAGLGLQPVLGLPGDRVVFGEKIFEVAGVRQPRLPDMPASGELVVPEKHWFIWPVLDTGGHGAGEFAAQRQAMFLKLAVVDQAAFVGQAFERWLFWKQAIP